MNDTSPEIEAHLRARYAAMTGSERAFMALQMFETAQLVVLSSLDPCLDEEQRRRELCRRFYGDEIARAAFPERPTAPELETKHDKPAVSKIEPDPISQAFGCLGSRIDTDELIRSLRGDPAK